MRWLLMAILSLGLVHCAQQSEPASDAAATSPPQSNKSTSEASPGDTVARPTAESENKSSSEDVMTMRNLVLTMSEENPTGDELQEPTFLVRADSGRLSESTGTWSLQGTRSVIHREDGDDIIIEAGEGVFNQETMTATLQGDVHLTVGAISMELSNLIWNNEARQATSENPATVSQAGNVLQTGSLLIEPDEDQLILRDVSGLWKLEGPNP